MRYVRVKCNYCGVENNLEYSEARYVDRCPHCGQRDLEKHDITAHKVDYYAGCPPFPEKKNVPDSYW